MGTITVGDDIYTTTDTSTVTISGSSTPYFTLDDNITLDLDNTYMESKIQLGKFELDEEKLGKLDALLNVIESLEDDNAIKELYNAQRMIDKIKGKL
tara:strand:+ start:264 stop:554 length:291 start_codon:yes stop_codon:yes gene_type:complete